MLDEDDAEELGFFNLKEQAVENLKDKFFFG
jgi:hypothetical protein